MTKKSKSSHTRNPVLRTIIFLLGGGGLTAIIVASIGAFSSKEGGKETSISANSSGSGDAIVAQSGSTVTIAKTEPVEKPLKPVVFDRFAILYGWWVGPEKIKASSAKDGTDIAFTVTNPNDADAVVDKIAVEVTSFKALGNRKVTSTTALMLGEKINGFVQMDAMTGVYEAKMNLPPQTFLKFGGHGEAGRIGLTLKGKAGIYNVRVFADYTVLGKAFTNQEIRRFEFAHFR